MISTEKQSATHHIPCQWIAEERDRIYIGFCQAAQGIAIPAVGKVTKVGNDEKHHRACNGETANAQNVAALQAKAKRSNGHKTHIGEDLRDTIKTRRIGEDSEITIGYELAENSQQKSIAFLKSSAWFKLCATFFANKNPEQIGRGFSV